MTASPLAGHFSVDASARRVRQYRHVEERTMRIMGGWIALTPELPAKILLGRHVWDDAQHADLWRRRLPELRASVQPAEAPAEGLVRFLAEMESAERPEQTPERLAGLYRVLKPHMIAVYADHLGCVNPIYEPPTQRILERCLDDERRHVAAGAVVLDAVVRQDDARRRAAAWAERLQTLLEAAGGVTGAWPPPGPAPVIHPHAARDVVALDSAFEAPDLPAGLGAALARHRLALERGDEQSALADLAAEAREEIRARLAGLPAAAATALVGVARVGSYRVVKLVVAGGAETLVLQEQWRPHGGDWRIASVEIARAVARG